MPTIAISVPSGAHHRSFLQPMRETLTAVPNWKFLVISPGAPWSDRLFPHADYPRDRFAFAENSAAPHLLETLRPAALITTTTGLDPADVPLLERARELGLRTVTFVESWDNVWKMERIVHGLGKAGQRMMLPDHLMIWNDIMKAHVLRAFGGDRSYKSYQTYQSYRTLLPSDVHVVGAPRLDYFGPRYAAQRPSREEALRFFGLLPEGRVLHLATTELYDHGHVAKAIGEAKHRGNLPPDLQLYASVHPGGDINRHRPWAERYGFTLRFSPGRHEPAPHPDFRYHPPSPRLRGAGPPREFDYNPTPADMLLLAATFKYTDVMVNLSSTAALESCLADRPTICAFFGKPFDWWRWHRSMVVRDFQEHYADLLRGGGIAVARDPQQLIRQITASLERPSKDREGRRRSAEIIATTLAGDSVERVLAILTRLVAR